MLPSDSIKPSAFAVMPRKVVKNRVAAEAGQCVAGTAAKLRRRCICGVAHALRGMAARHGRAQTAWGRSRRPHLVRPPCPFGARRSYHRRRRCVELHMPSATPMCGAAHAAGDADVWSCTCHPRRRRVELHMPSRRRRVELHMPSATPTCGAAHAIGDADMWSCTCHRRRRHVELHMPSATPTCRIAHAVGNADV